MHFEAGSSKDSVRVLTVAYIKQQHSNQPEEEEALTMTRCMSWPWSRLINCKANKRRRRDHGSGLFLAHVLVLAAGLVGCCVSLSSA